MLPLVLTIIISALAPQTNCVPTKRSIFNIAPIEVRFPSNIQFGNPGARRTYNPLFPVPEISGIGIPDGPGGPFQFANNIFNKNSDNIIPRRHYETSENSLNGRVQMKYKMNANFNHANVETGKDHTFKETTVTPATTLWPKVENSWAGIFNGNEVFTTPDTDGVSDESTDATESTTEFDTTTTDDLLNRMAIPSSVLASLAG